MNGRVRWLLREVYADTRFHSVPGSSLDERRRHVESFQEHLLALADAGPKSVGPARSFLRRTYVPLANAGYVAPGGDHWNFVSGHGNTEVSPAQMMHFVTEQIYAIRHYALRHPGRAPAGRMGFSWDPINRFEVPAGEFAGQIAALRERIALAIRDAYRPARGQPSARAFPPAHARTGAEPAALEPASRRSGRSSNRGGDAASAVMGSSGRGVKVPMRPRFLAMSVLGVAAVASVGGGLAATPRTDWTLDRLPAVRRLVRPGSLRRRHRESPRPQAHTRREGRRGLCLVN